MTELFIKNQYQCYVQLFKRCMLILLFFNSGEILAFDNHRILHGRKGYQGSRLLIGGYLDWDLLRSRTRVLKSKLSDKNIN